MSVRLQTSVLTTEEKSAYQSVTLGKSHSIFRTQFHYNGDLKVSFKDFLFDFWILLLCTVRNVLHPDDGFLVFDDDIATSIIWEFHLWREKTRIYLI